MVNTKKVISIGYIAIILFLTGCAEKKNPSEEIHKVLEKVVAAEKVFQEQQDPLVTLEKQEKVIYDEMIILGKKEQAKINDLADKAIALTEKREVHLSKEQKSIKASQKEFFKIEKIIDKIEKKEISKKAEKLNRIMNERYEAHDLMYKEYLVSLNSDRKLYELFKQKDVTLNQLEAQINVLNQNYKQVFELNEKFNALTEQYNQEKLNFYHVSGLKIDEK